MSLANLLVAQSESEDELLENAPLAVDACSKAETVLLAVLQADPTNDKALKKLLACYVRRSDLFKMLSQFPQAFADLDHAMEFHPDNVGLLRNKAWSLANCPDSAYRDLQQALALGDACHAAAS